MSQVDQARQCFREVGVPVAVSDNDWAFDSSLLEFASEGARKFVVAFIDRALPPKQAVMAADLDETVVRDPFAARGVAQKRQNVVGLPGSSVAAEQDRIHAGCFGLHVEQFKQKSVLFAWISPADVL